jgi:hypothetical protein
MDGSVEDAGLIIEWTAKSPDMKNALYIFLER